MKLINATRTLIVLCIILIATSAQAQQPLVLGGGLKHPMGLIASRILTEAYNKIGVTIETRELPSERSLRLADTGKIDGELFRGENAITPKTAPNLVKIPVPIAYGQLVVFTKDKSFEVTGWDSLAPYKIGTLIGLKEAEEKTQEMKVEKSVEPDALFKKLDAGRNDVLVLPKDLGLMIIKQLNLPGGKAIRILEPPLQEDKLYHYINKKHKDLIPKITRILQQMEADGEIQRIREAAEAELFN